MTMDPKDRKSDTSQEMNWEQDLDTIQAAYSGLETCEPPELLDQMVLNRARRALSARKRKPMRWIGAFATASVLVLALTIVVQQDQAPAVPGRSNGIKLDSTTEQEPTVGESANTPAEFSLPQSIAVGGREDNRARMEQSGAAKLEENLGSELATGPDAKSAEAVSPAKPAAVDVASPATPAAIIEEQTADADFDRGDAPVPSDSEEHFRERTNELKEVSRQTTPELEKRKFDDEARRKMQDGLSGGLLREEEQDEFAEKAPDAEEWIQHMLELFESNQESELELELAAFRKAYPDYILPPELAD